MKLPDNVYQILKWITLVCIPALTTLYVTISNVLGWPMGSEVAQISAAVCTCLGVLIGISTITYSGGEKNVK